MQRGDREILRGPIDFAIRRGDFVAITGPNGGGKTTLLRIMLKLLKPSTGSVEYFSIDGTPDLKPTIGYLPQKTAIDSRFPITVSQLIGQGLLPEKTMTREQKALRISETLSSLELDGYARHGLSQLSGGQLQRALLGRALVSRPELLVLDEPLSYLDKHFEHRVYDLLDALKERTTIVLVSHEVSTIAGMATCHIIVNQSLHFCKSHSHFVHYDCE